MKHQCFTLMVTAATLESREEGRDLLTLISDLVPALTPERYGNYTPMKDAPADGSSEEMLENWEWPFLWTRKRGRVSGSVWPGISPPPKQGGIKLQFQEGVVAQDSLVELLRAVAQRFQADFAVAHVLTPQEIELGKGQHSVVFTHRDGRGAMLSIPAIKLQKKYVPDLYWLTLFGPPYVRIFGRDRLLAAPVHSVEELPCGGILLQLTPELADLSQRYEHLLEVRRRAKDHLNHDVFFDPQKGPNHSYTLPDFLHRESPASNPGEDVSLVR